MRKPTRREFSALKRKVAKLKGRTGTRSIQTISYEPPPEMGDYDDPCAYERFWANYAWIETATVIAEKLAWYESFRSAAQDCIDSHSV